MSKAHRGKGIRDQVARGRGVCPVCKRSGVKLLYELEAGSNAADGSGASKIKVCKACKAAVANGKKSIS